MFQNLKIFLKALLAQVQRTKNHEWQTVVIVQLAKLGDMVCTTPMFRAIKAQYPNRRVIVVGSRLNKELLTGNSDVDLYIEFEGNVAATAEVLRKQNADWGIITAPNFKAAAILRLAGISQIVAPYLPKDYCPQQTLLYRALTRAARRIDFYYGQYVPGLYLKLLAPLGIESQDTRKHLSFSEAARNKVSEFWQKNNISETDLVIGVSPSSGNKIKNWSAANFAKVVEELYREYQAKILIFGGQRDIQEVNELKTYLTGLSYIDASGNFSVDELKALIYGLDLFIAVDTGPIYIAEAFDVATVDIVGSVDEREQPPQGEIHQIVKLPDRGPAAVHIFNARILDTKEARRQIEGISPELVLRAAHEIISRLK